MKFNFDEWEHPEYGLGKNNALLPNDIWASGASAAGFLGGVFCGESVYYAAYAFTV